MLATLKIFRIACSRSAGSSHRIENNFRRIRGCFQESLFLLCKCSFGIGVNFFFIEEREINRKKGSFY